MLGAAGANKPTLNVQVCELHGMAWIIIIPGGGAIGSQWSALLGCLSVSTLSVPVLRPYDVRLAISGVAFPVHHT